MRFKCFYTVSAFTLCIFVFSWSFVLYLRHKPWNSFENKLKQTELIVKEYVANAEALVDLDKINANKKHEPNVKMKTKEGKIETVPAEAYTKNDSAPFEANNLSFNYKDVNNKDNLKQDEHENEDDLNSSHRDINKLSEYERYFIKRETKQWEWKYKYKIDAPKVCEEADYRFLVLVLSAASNVERRDTIRGTWAAVAPDRRGLVMFVLAHTPHTDEDVEQESDYYNDIIQIQFLDVYQNLVLKTIAGLRWVREYCSDVRYVVKMDDDVILNLEKLSEIVESQLQYKPDLMLGGVADSNRVLRRGKWQVAKNAYPFDYFPEHLSGGVYVLSMLMNSQIIDAVEYVPKLSIEDVFITGIVRKTINATITRNYMFPSWLSRSPRSECKFIGEDLIALHGYGSINMQTMWERFEIKDYTGC